MCNRFQIGKNHNDGETHCQAAQHEEGERCQTWCKRGFKPLSLDVKVKTSEEAREEIAKKWETEKRICQLEGLESNKLFLWQN